MHHMRQTDSTWCPVGRRSAGMKRWPYDKGRHVSSWCRPSSYTNQIARTDNGREKRAAAVVRWQRNRISRRQKSAAASFLGLGHCWRVYRSIGRAVVAVAVAVVSSNNTTSWMTDWAQINNAPPAVNISSPSAAFWICWGRHAMDVTSTCRQFIGIPTFQPDISRRYHSSNKISFYLLPTTRESANVCI